MADNAEDGQYQCDICDSRFSQSGTMNRHMRIHSSSYFSNPVRKGVLREISEY